MTTHPNEELLPSGDAAFATRPPEVEVSTIANDQPGSDERNSEPPADATGPPVAPRRRRRWPWVAAAVAVAGVVIVGVVVVALVQTPPLTHDGQEIAQPERVLSAGERMVDDIVEARNGATNDQTRCYFSLAAGEESDISDLLRCGPVLFVDGEPDAPYLSLPMTAEDDGDTTRLTVGDAEGDESPTALDRGETLRRPDGLAPPEGAGGLEAPLPPRAGAGLLEVHDLEGVDLAKAGPASTIVSFSRTFDLTGLATPDRFGQGDEARRAAEGEMLVAVEFRLTPGSEGVASELPFVHVQVDEGDPRAVPEEFQSATGPIGMVLSVPEDTNRVDLVVREVDVEQRLSLLTGDPAPENPSVLRRANREQALDAGQPLTFTASAPGFLTETFTITATILGVDLQWFFGASGTIHPADPDRAYLVVEHDLVWPQPFEPDTALEEPFWTLTLADGTSIRAINIDEDRPEWVTIAFEVPADFTEGTITIGGRHTFPEDNDTWDFGTNRLDIPVSIPAG